MSIYQLKPAFQRLLRPTVGWLFGCGVSANQVTVCACLVSIALGVGLFVIDPEPIWFVLVPAWMLLRMAFNAVDGMLAREHGQQTALGGFLNELTDVVSDAALYLPFVWVLPGHPFWVGLVITLAGLSELAGALGPTVGASRRYDGPMGKSDRAAVFGVVGLVVSFGIAMPVWMTAFMPVIAVLTAMTVVRRVRGALDERSRANSGPDVSPII
jgi:CDP-diacylglycerol--glycerol-3-phosphate 3-phosphatidyltransferase